jgi:hypothetical protein
MPEPLAARRLLLYGTGAAYVLAGAWSIDHLGRYDAWAVGAGGALGLAVLVLRIGRV